MYLMSCLSTLFVLCLHIFLHVVYIRVCLCMSSCPHFLLYSGSCLSFVFLYQPPPNVFQVRTLASAGGPDNLVMLDPAKYKARPRVPEPAGDGSSTQPKWQVGEQEYEALMRMLDNLVSVKKSFCGEWSTKNLQPLPYH